MTLEFSTAPTAGERHELEYRLQAHDGRTVRVRDSVRVVLGQEGGQTVRLRGVITDVTEHRELEARLLQSQKMEAVGQLAGGIAHDFNNLLTVIAGYADRLLDRAGDATTRLEVRQIREAAERATSLIGQLLAFSRRAPQHVELVDLEALVHDLETLIGRLIGEHIAITVRTAPGLGPVRADRRQLEQVVINLAVNARDAMPDGGEIRIETAAAEVDDETARERGVAPGQYAMLIVSDTGTGMSEETRSARVRAVLHDEAVRAKGTGLGLATAYGIVQAAGGYITIESELGRGTDVAVHLPGVATQESEDEEAVDETRHDRDDPARRGRVGGTGPRAPHPRRGRYDIVEARGGREALALVERLGTRFDLLLTDVVMPDVGGPEVAARLRARRPDVKVVYMSGYADSALYRRGLSESDAFMLRKPFTPEALVGMVEEALRDRAAGSTVPSPSGSAIEPAAGRARPLTALEDLAVPVLEPLEPGDDSNAAERDLARAGVEGDVVGLTGPVGEVREPARAASKRMRDTRSGGPRYDMAGPDRVLVLAQQERSVSLEHHEQLLLRRMAVRRGAELAGRHGDEVQPRAHRADRPCRDPGRSSGRRRPLRTPRPEPRLRRRSCPGARSAPARRARRPPPRAPRDACRGGQRPSRDPCARRRLEGGTCRPAAFAFRRRARRCRPGRPATYASSRR